MVAFLANLLASEIASALNSNIALWATIFIGFLTPVFIGMINYGFLYQVRAISARNDDNHHRPTAIALSLVLFLVLIAAYAAIYAIEMPQQFKDVGYAQGLPAMLHQVIGAIYFSAITISTLGYGDIYPHGDFARITAAVEALNGLIAFGVFTGAVTGFMANKAAGEMQPLGENAHRHDENSQNPGD